MSFKRPFMGLRDDGAIFYISNCNVPNRPKSIFIYFHDIPLCGSFKSGLILNFKNEI